ncbi:MAG TPA: class I SAM-dependent methyltransferase, partial [Thermoleophilia bacterium]|nr:class I SAM-dependent methyltransferase [Thermoleophilia bacterium]
RRAAALARLRAARSTPAGGSVPVAFGYDRDARAVALARAAVTRAGLQELVRVEARDLAKLAVPAELATAAPSRDGAGAASPRDAGTSVAAGVPGLIVANPPYGRRLGAGARPARKTAGAASPRDAAPSPADPALVRLYELLGARLREGFMGWRAAILVNDLDLGKRLGLRARRTNRFMNGPLPCTLLRIDIDARAVAARPAQSGRPGAATPAGRPVATSTPATATAAGAATPAIGAAATATPRSVPVEQFANRLAKNARRWSRFMRRAGIGCYRVYDGDLPDFALAIDIYERWVHVQEYAPPPEIDEAKAAARLAEAMRVVPEVLGVAASDVFLKVRARQRGTAQYERRKTGGTEHEVHEGELAFLVNFTDYLDTGLFLPGREVRRLLARLASGQRFLNLFGYTGAATVAAARGGAAHTTTVDLNGGYLAWAERNFALNKLKASRNQVIEADVLRWVAQTDDRFGLIYLDPPTFSNSKKMGRATFDVRRDHADLIRLVARRLLEPGGVLIFACNARRFAFDVAALTQDHDLEDLSRATLPPDFARSARSHHVWRVGVRQ